MRLPQRLPRLRWTSQRSGDKREAAYVRTASGACESVNQIPSPAAGAHDLAPVAERGQDGADPAQQEVELNQWVSGEAYQDQREEDRIDQQTEAGEDRGFDERSSPVVPGQPSHDKGEQCAEREPDSERPDCLTQ